MYLDEKGQPEESAIKTRMAVQRDQALDAMRGLAVAGMIFVNSPGSWEYVWRPFGHADWHGYTPTDLVFPFFLFISGSAMFFAFKRYDYQPSPEALRKLGRRVVLIFVIGLLLHLYAFTHPLEELRIMGVLQRIALCYGIAALAVLYLSARGVLIFSVLLLLGYWLLLLGAAGDMAYTLEGNLVVRVDLAILGASHMWDGKGVPFDPEGLLSTLPAVVNVTTGYLATRWLAKMKDVHEKVQKLVLAGIALIGVGHLWDLGFPINKGLWTSSYVVVTSGWALLVLVALIKASQSILGRRLLEPLRIYGTNPLFIYSLSWLWVASYGLVSLPYGGESVSLNEFLFGQVLWAVGNPYLASHLYALAHVIFFWWLSRLLYARNIFIKI
jgi:predicted acyltransferase